MCYRLQLKSVSLQAGFKTEVAYGGAGPMFIENVM